VSLPSEAEFKEWQDHPVTEWVFARVAAFAAQQRERWANAAWDSGELAPELFAEARVRADCYLSLSQSSYDDWKAIDDTGD
jgi:hypothetical protein